MNIQNGHFVGSVLKVTASEKIDIAKDLLSPIDTSISQLLQDSEEKTSEKEISKDQETTQSYKNNKDS